MKTLRELREKTLTPAEKKKREEIAKAMEKDNPDMPMDKKMAIATATAKRVAESDFEPHMMYDPKTGKGYKAEKPEDHVRMKKMGYTHEKPEVNEGKMKDAMLQRKDMAKLAGLYSKAMKAMPGSPAQKKIKAQIDQYRRELGMNESLEEQKDDAEYNDEGGMAISQLKTAKSAVEELMSIIKDDDNLPEWVQSKLTKAVDYMDSVRDYMSSEKDEVQEAVKTTHVVIDTANGNKVVATASDEKGAKSSIASAERPPMNIKNKKTLKIVKLKRPVGDKQVDRMVGYPLKEAVTEAKGKYASDAQMNDFLKAMEKNPDVKKMSKHYNRPVGDIVNALRARVSVNRLRGGNVYTLNFTDKDSKLKVKAKKQYAPMKEAVSPAQQAAIAIAKKEKGDVKEAKDDMFQVNIKGEGGATVRAKSEKDAINKAFRKLGIATRFTRDRRYMTKVQVVPAESVEESRAYRDAMRSMKGNTKGMATTKKDKDTEASDDDRKAASKNIIMQLRKAADLPTGTTIEFEKGKGKVDRATAQNVLAKFNRLPKPRDREQMQNSIKSLADIKKILGR
jgi:hypothetical protein